MGLYPALHVLASCFIHPSFLVFPPGASPGPGSRGADERRRRRRDVPRSRGQRRRRRRVLPPAPGRSGNAPQRQRKSSLEKRGRNYSRYLHSGDLNEENVANLKYDFQKYRFEKKHINLGTIVV